MKNQNQSTDLRSWTTDRLLAMINHCYICSDYKGRPRNPYPDPYTYRDFRKEMDYRIKNARTIEEFITNKF